MRHLDFILLPKGRGSETSGLCLHSRIVIVPPENCQVMEKEKRSHPGTAPKKINRVSGLPIEKKRK